MPSPSLFSLLNQSIYLSLFRSHFNILYTIKYTAYKHYYTHTYARALLLSDTRQHCGKKEAQHNTHTYTHTRVHIHTHSSFCIISIHLEWPPLPFFLSPCHPTRPPAFFPTTAWRAFFLSLFLSLRHHHHHHCYCYYCHYFLSYSNYGIHGLMYSLL